MSQTIKLKRSAVAGKVPTTSSLDLGEIALNTNDGKAYLKKNDGSESIQTFVVTDSLTTGSIVLTGQVSASVFSGSFFGNGTGLTRNMAVTGSDVLGNQFEDHVSVLHFDSDTGINVSASAPNTAFIKLGSHFRDFFVDGSATIVATGSDQMDIIANGGLDISTSLTDTNGNGVSKELIFAVDATVARTGSNTFTADQTIEGKVTSSTLDTSGNAIIRGDLDVLGDINITGEIDGHISVTPVASDSNNSNGVVIQDLTFDGFGHTRTLGTVDLDDRYFTETEADNRFVNVTGDSISGSLIVSASGATNDFLVGDTKLFVSASGNVGIGTTSPATNLDVVDAIPIVTLRSDSNSYASLSYNSNNVQKGLITYHAGNDSLQLSHKETGTTSNDPHLVIKEGNVGIGTTSPSTKLHLTDTSAGFQFTADTGTAGDGRLNIGHFSNGTFIGTYGDDGGAADVIRFGTHSGDERMRIDTDGQVYFKSSTAYKIGLNDSAGVNQWWLKSSTNGDFALHENGVGDQFTIQAGGNVGIGTTSPTNKLHVAAGSSAIALNEYNNGAIIWLDGSNGDFTGGDYFNLYAPNETRVSLGYAGGEVLTVTSGSNVGIGTTTPDTKLHVFSTSADPAKIITNSVTNSSLVIGNTSTGYAVLNIDGSNGDATGADYLSIVQNNDLTANIYTQVNAGVLTLGSKGTSNAITIDGSNVGIGTDNPSSNLHISGSSEAVFKIQSNRNDIRLLEDDTTDTNSLIRHQTGLLRFDTISDDELTVTTRVALDHSTGYFGIGTISPDGRLHVHNGSAGSVTANTNADDFVIENNTAGGMSILTPADQNGNIYFGTVSDNKSAEIVWVDSTDTLLLGSSTSAGNIKIRTGNQSDAVTILTSGNVGIGTTSPGRTLHVDGGSSPAARFQTTSDGTIELFSTNSWTGIKFMDSGAVDEHLWFNGTYGTFAIGGGGSVVSGKKLHVHGGMSVGANSSATSVPSNGLFVEGDLTVGGKVTAQEFHTEFVSASIVYQSGSTKFGDTSDDVHSFSGSLRVTGSGDHYFTDGRLGIGTTTPGTVLDIHGTGNVLHVGTGTNTAQYMSFRGSGASGAYIGYDGTGMMLQPGDSKRFLIRAGHATFSSGTAALAVDTSGNVGIGTVTPPHKFSVFGTGAGNATVQIEGEGGADPFINFLANNTQHWALGIDDSDGDKFKLSKHSALGTNDYLVVDTSGNVGIGTTSPNAKLEILSDGSAATGAEIRLQHANNNSTDVVSTVNFANNAGSVAMIQGGTTGANNTGYISFFTDNAGSSSEKMRIIGNGNVGIGTSSPSYPLEVDTGAGTFSVRAKGGSSVTLASDASLTYFGSTHEFYNAAGSSEHMRIDSSGNVGIGTTSPSFLLHVQGTPPATNGALINARNSAATTSNTTFGGIFFNSAPGYDFSIGKSNVNSDTTLSFRNGNDGVSLMDITPTGNVGIGTSSPSYALDIERTSGEVAIQLQARDNSSNSSLYFGDNADADVGSLIYNHGSNYMAFTSNASERMRIISSGDVLIGKTSDNPNVAGTRIYPTGLLAVAREAAPPLYLNRRTSNGDIVDFRKGGVAVGSISADADGLGIGSTDVGLLFLTVGQDRIIPRKVSTTAVSNNLIDLGDAGSQFKDLYLGGHAKIATALTASGLIYPTSDGTINQVIATDGNGNLSFISPGAATAFPFTGDAVITGSLIVSASGATNDLQIGDDKLFVGSNGNVGIGTTSPSAVLHMSAASPTFYLDDTSTTGTRTRFQLITGDVGSTQSALFSFNNTSATSLLDVMTLNETGNVGIGTTGPDHTLMLQKDVHGEWEALRLFNYHSDGATQGSVTINMDVRASNGQVARASIKARESTADAPYSELGFFTSNTTGTAPTERLTIDKDGNVGIGTTSPAALLDVVGSYTDNAVRVQNTNSSYFSAIGFVSSSGDLKGAMGVGNSGAGAPYANNAYVYTTAGTDFLVATGTTEKMRVTSGGNVGIGTTSPAHKLDLSDSSTTWAAKILNTNANGQGLLVRSDTTNDDSILGVYGNGSYRMIVKGDGNVGIGTTSPDSKLHVSSGDIRITNNSPSIYFYDSDVSGLYHRILGGGNKGLEYSVDPNNATAGYHRWDIGGSEVMRLIEGGNLGIGTTSPTRGITIDKSNGDAALNIVKNNTGNQIVYLGTGASSAVEAGILQLSHQGSVKAQIYTSGDSYFNGGNVGIGTTSPSSKLQVKGLLGIERSNTTDTSTISMEGNFIFNAASGYHYKFKNNTTDLVHFDSNGNVGIGTISPYSKLELNQSAAGAPLRLRSESGNSGNVGMMFSVADNTVTTDAYQKGAIYFQGDGTGNAVGDLVFAVNNTLSSANVSISDEKLRIKRTGEITMPGDLTVGGTVTAQEFHTEFVSASIVYQSGSTKFGDTSDDVHAFTGSVDVDGEVSIVRSASNSQLKVKRTTSATGEFNIYTNSDSLYFQNVGQSTYPMVITSLGRLGLGTITPDRQLQVHEGTSGTSTMKFTNSTTGEDGDTGFFVGINGSEQPILYGYNSTDMVFGTSGQERMRIDSSGNVSIGTTTSSGLLTVGNGLTGTKTIAINGAGSSTSVMNLDFLGGGTGNPSGRISYSSSTEAMTFHTGDLASISERMRIDSSGNIFATNSSNNLVIGNSASGGVYLGGGNSNTTLISLQVGSSERMRIDSSGNVGIGTTGPSTKLHLYESGASDVIFRITPANASYDSLIQLTGQGNDMTDEGFEIWYDNSVGDVHLSTTYPNDAAAIRFHTRTGASKSTSNERMTIDGNGNVGIGTTSPLTTLHLSTTTGGQIYLEDSNSGDATNITEFSNNGGNFSLQTRSNTGTFVSTDYQAVKNSNGTNYHRWFTNGSNERMRIDSSGNVGIGTASPTNKLHVAAGSSAIALNEYNNGAIIWLDGSNGDFTGGDYFNLYAPNETRVSLGYIGGEVLTVTSGSNVGIGTTSPSDKLDIFDGNAQMVFGAASSDRSWLQFKHNAVPADGEELGLLDFRGYNDASEDTRYVILTSKAEDVTDGSEDGSLTFQTMANGTATQTLTMRSGNVGIGTTSPDLKLHLNHSDSNNGLLLQNSNNVNDFQVLLNIRENEGLIFQRWVDGAFANNLMTIGYDGQVGIGTTSPDAPLQVAAGTSLPITTAGTGTISFGSISSTSTPTIMGRQTSNTVGLYLLGSTTDANSNGDMVFNVRENNNSTFATLTNPAFKFSHFSTELVTILRNGNVGVGTTSPAPFLSNANAAVDVGNSNGGEFVARRSGGQANLAMGVTGGNIGYLYSTTNTPMVFGVNNAERVRIDTSGNVGMNAIPENSSGTWRNYQLGSLSMAGRASDVNPDAMFGTNFKFTTANAEQRISAHATSRLFFNDDVLKFQNAGSGTAGSAISWNDRFIINSSGRVGIGESTPLGALHIKVASDTSDIQLESSGGSGRRYEIQSRTDGSFTIFDGTGSTERMRIDSSGNVLVGKTSLDDFSSAGAQIESGGQITTSVAGAPSLRLNRGTNDGVLIELNRAGTTVGSIGSISSDLYIAESNVGLRFDGENNQILPSSTTASTDNTCNLGASGARFKDLHLAGTATVGSLVETSTRKLKENIETLEDQSSIVDSLQPVSYTWKETEKEDFGLIAEDVADIAPHLVERDEEGNPSGIKYSKLSVLLLDVVQRQSTLIEDLNKRITKLENERGN